MTNSNNPQSKETVTKSVPSSVKDFNAHFAAKTAEKMVKAAEKVERREETRQDRASRPWTEREIKAFFDHKKEQAANRTPEQVAEARNGFFQRKAEQYNRNREENFNELKAQPAHKSSSDETLYKLAEMRMGHKRDLVKDGMDGAAFDKGVEKFDKHFSKAENLQAVIDTAKEKTVEILAQKVEKSAVKPQEVGASL